jgi:uncharacterized repeat protein (TIGR01451 family)
MKKHFYILITLLMLCLSQTVFAQIRAFTPRYNNPSVRGNIVYVSNSIVTTTGFGTPAGSGDAAARAEIPPAGTSNNNGTSDYGRNIDVDADGTTFNSSTSDLSLTSCSSILFAGLYWGAGRGQDVDTTWRVGENVCKLKLPGSATYTNITASKVDYINDVRVITSPVINWNSYSCFADITTQVQALANANGTYTVANVVSPATGSTTRDNCFGGWTIVIVYANPALLPRNLTVFDGCAAIRGGANTVNVNVNGFLTPPAGPVSCELGAVVLDGDRNQADSFAFRQGPPPPAAGAFYNLAQTATNPTSGNNDMWNSAITYKGVPVATRNPAYQNTMGYDASIINLPNTANAQLGNSQTQATVRFATPSESYSVYVLTTSISIYNPSFSFDKTSTDLNGGALNPGDILQYRVNYNNVGNDASTNSVITDNIPAGTTYIAGTLQINGVAKTDAAGDDEAEYDFTNNRVVFRIGTGANASTGGVIASAGTGFVRFNVATPSSCIVATCTGPLQNSARIDYRGQTSLNVLLDSSGVLTSGCIVKGPLINTLSAVCYNPLDTLVRNACPALTLVLPYAKYGGYTFYSAMPFIPANVFNPFTTISASRTYYAYYNTGIGCSDTVIIHAFITACPDIDDDNDGIPDYVEINNPLALADHDGDLIPNWNDIHYTGYVDNNADGFNDNFDPAADSDADGIPNFYDTNFPGYVDTNGDALNDNMDKDLDGIPNNYDLDSDNDGIPDVVESLGVDVLGDGRIDNYTDTDNDGLSQNVDASNTGVAGSASGLGALDIDGDGIPNYLDLDSDNDGIPDLVEVYGTDANNNGRVDVFVDIDGDGYADSVDGDVGNDGTAENSANCLLLTGVDAGTDGRADSYPNKNFDRDARPNAYDLDSDADGLTDVKEARFTDANYNGMIDGAVNSNGWNTGIAGLGSLPLPNTDGTGRVNIYDIDSDDDGIPDNIEGQLTTGNLLPSGTDSDLDGLDNTYDNFVGFGGNGTPYPDTDGDTVPDFMDTDADNDGLPDILEGSDLNFNGEPDDGVALAGADTDGDGLDNFFDLNNSSVEGTSAYMGTFGSTTGDPTPGTRATVQHTNLGLAGCATERDWRCLSLVLSCKLINFKSLLYNQTVHLDWSVLCRQEVKQFSIERSIDRANFIEAQKVPGRPVIQETELYNALDDISSVDAGVKQIYYRLRTIYKNGSTSLSNIIAIQRKNKDDNDIHIAPNPVKDDLHVYITAISSLEAKIYIMDGQGKVVQKLTERIFAGNNTLLLNQSRNLSNGIYYLRVYMGDKLIIKKFSIVK